jgi:glycosyltransferase involved in cell wall biosynthesis
MEKNKIVYINARFLTQPITGVQRFAIELCEELIKLDLEIKLISPKNILHPDLSKRFKNKTIGSLEGHLWEQIELPLYLKKKGNPILLNLCNTSPLFYSNSIVTLHDLAFIKHPEWFSFAFKSFYNFLIPKTIKKAKMILTVSNSVKSDIKNYFNHKENNIHVVYNGLPLIFQNAKNSSLKVKRPYFLAMGGKNPRKNLNNVLAAMQLLGNTDFDLRVIGRAEQNFNSVKIDDKKYDFNLIYHSDIDDNQLQELYSGAKALIYPSFYEGFGLPPLEALNSNCPIILSDIEVFRELYEDVATFTDPNNVEDIKSSIEKIINNEFETLTIEKKNELNEKYSYWNAAKIVSNRVAEFI